MGFTIVYWISFIIGVLTGLVIASILRRYFVVGTLKIDHSNPEKEIYRFDVKDIDSLSKQKMITLKVDNNANLSQE